MSSAATAETEGRLQAVVPTETAEFMLVIAARSRPFDWKYTSKMPFDPSQ